MSNFEKIFTPIKFGTLELPNRIVMSPMVTHYATDNGTVTQRVIDYYTARAAGGVGLITVEATFVDLKSLEHHMLGIYDDKMVPGLKKLADAIHAAGGRASIQLIHKGRLAKSATTTMRTVSASNEPDMGETPRALTVPEIHELVEKFGQAARRAKEAGFDAVEMHMAHGYILNQFLSPYSNHRTDAYGGSMENRARFPLEVVRRVRKEVGPDFPITAKINSTEHVECGIEAEDWKILLPMLEEAGINAVNVSGGLAETTHYMTAPMSIDRAFNVERAKQIKSYANIPVGVVGRIPDIRLAEEILESGAVDFITMGRANIADPELVNKAKEGRVDDICPCINCNQGCIGRVDQWLDVCCLANPLAGREGDPRLKITPAPVKKNVVVVGGGPAGLSAAATAAKRGHKVTLFESCDILGGQLYLASLPPKKEEITRLLKYLEHNARKSGVDIVLNHKATAADIESMKPDEVIIATGGTPITLKIHGAERCVLAGNVLTGKAQVPGSCVVIGGGSVGCETADYMTEHGSQVVIIEMLSEMCRDLEKRQRKLLMQKLIHAGTETICCAKVREVGEDYVEYESLGMVRRVMGVEHVVMAAGYKGSVPADVQEACDKQNIPVHIVGDCTMNSHNALVGIREGYDCAVVL